jgi:hypothetical protein
MPRHFAAIVRADITVKMHPAMAGILLFGRKLCEGKDGYTEWQLLEEQ